MTVPHYTNYIDGEWSDAAERYEIRSPANNELVATVAQGTVSDIDRAVAAAQAAHKSGVWRNTPPEKRASLIHAAATYLENRAEELAQLQTRENGTTIRITQAMHVALSVAQLRYLADLATTYKFETRGPSIEGPVPADGLVRREPLGVVAAIVPWNVPLLTAVWKVGAALSAGNTIVLKPDEHAPLLVLELVKAFEAAGLPSGVLNAVVGDGEPVGAHLSSHADVRKVAFTGSTAVGRSILKASGDDIKRVTLELGGKGPNIILDGADLDVAVDNALFASMANNGQACEAGTRLLVPAERYDEIVERLVQRAATLSVGDPLDPATHIGPVVSEVQHKRIVDYIAIAQKEGARLAFGGKVPTGEGFDTGYWIEPTIFTGVTNTMRIAREEVFGPVLVAIPYSTIDEAIEIANDTEYGLSAGIFGPEDTALEIAKRIDAGMVWINEWHVINPMYPFGGMKQSGLGREGGPDALDAYTEPKFIALNRSAGPEQRAFALVLDPA